MLFRSSDLAAALIVALRPQPPRRRFDMRKYPPAAV